MALGCEISALEEVRLHVADAQPAHREGKTWCEDVLRWYRLSIRVVERSPRGDQHGAHVRLHAVNLREVAQAGNLLLGLALGCYPRPSEPCDVQGETSTVKTAVLTWP